MATPLKYMYDPHYFERICPVLQTHLSGFDCRDFIFRIFNNRWPDLALKERVRHIATALHHFLPDTFPEAAARLVSIAEQLRSSERSQAFAHIFIPEYVEMYGRAHPEASLSALEQITRLVSAEFAVRPFLMEYPDLTMRYFYKWSKSDDANVRRLSSEGCRPRLPWAAAIASLKKDPRPVLPILENLKADASEYVRRSVANHLNDIAKDHPQIVLHLVRGWHGKNQHTDWIIKHGCRTLLKKGDTQALNLLGFNPVNKAAVRKLLLPQKVRIGQHLDFEFTFVSREQKPVPFRLEYAIDYITSTGKTSRKIFKISEKVFEPGKPVMIQRKQSFRNLTTRKHFTGDHRISILANGKKLAASEFLVC